MKPQTNGTKGPPNITDNGSVFPAGPKNCRLVIQDKYIVESPASNYFFTHMCLLGKNPEGQGKS